MESQKPTGYVWLWEMPLSEILRNFFPAFNNGPIPAETVPFKCSKRPAGNGLHYQLALPPELRAVQSEVPASGDHRAGILIFDGDTIIGSFMLRAAAHTLQVLPGYRGRGVSGLLFTYYYQEVRFIPGMGSISPLALRAFVSAHARIVRWAVQTGKDVPQRVIDAVESGQEAAHLLRRVGIAA